MAGPGPQTLRSTSVGILRPLSFGRRTPCVAISRPRKASGRQSTRAEQATSIAPAEQEQQQHQAESNGIGAAAIHDQQHATSSPELKSDLEVDSVLAKELGENGMP